MYTETEKSRPSWTAFEVSGQKREKDGWRKCDPKTVFKCSKYWWNKKMKERSEKEKKLEKGRESSSENWLHWRESEDKMRRKDDLFLRFILIRKQKQSESVAFTSSPFISLLVDVFRLFFSGSQIHGQTQVSFCDHLTNLV